MLGVDVSSVRLAMLDVDGTLRDMDTWLPGAMDLLAECVARNWVIALCSGRPANSLKVVAAEVDQVLPGAVGYIASGNGTAIWRRAGDSWDLAHQRTVPAAAVDGLVEWATTHQLAYWGFTAEDWIAAVDDELTQMIAGFVGVEPIIAPVCGRDDIMKLEFVSESYAQSDGHDQHQVRIPEDLLRPHGLAAVSSVPGSVDVVPEIAAGTKGGDLLTAELGIGWENVFAVGNGGNDLGMLAKAPVSAALPPLDHQQATTVRARLCAGPQEVRRWLVTLPAAGA